MHWQAVVGGRFRRQFNNRAAGRDGDPTLHLIVRELATPWIALRLWRKRRNFPHEPHNVSGELDRNA